MGTLVILPHGWTEGKKQNDQDHIHTSKSLKSTYVQFVGGNSEYAWGPQYLWF